MWLTPLIIAFQIKESVVLAEASKHEVLKKYLAFSNGDNRKFTLVYF